MQQPNPHGEPSLLWIWGETQRAFGRIDSGLQALHLRQDDTRRELLTHIGQIHSKLDGKPVGASMNWRSALKFVPWDRLAFWALTTLGALGWIRPSWIKALTGG